MCVCVYVCMCVCVYVSPSGVNAWGFSLQSSISRIKTNQKKLLRPCQHTRQGSSHPYIGMLLSFDFFLQELWINKVLQSS